RLPAARAPGPRPADAGLARPRSGVGGEMTAMAAMLVVVTGATLRLALAAGRTTGVRRRLDGGQAARPGLDGALEGLPPPPAFVLRWLDGAGLEAPATTVWWGWALASAGLCGGLLLVVGPAAAALGASAAVVAPLVALRTSRGRGDLRLERGLPGALEAVARALRSGASLRQAISEA